MITQNIDGISFQMKEESDFSLLSNYGKVFRVFAQNDSGNIGFGTDDGENKYFIKIAGAKTARSCRSTEEAVEALRLAMPIYTDLAHTNLIRLIKHCESNGLYAAVFKWTDGDCLFDYWNFELYQSRPELVSPRKRFEELPRAKKLAAFTTIFEFLIKAESRGYVAVDFYDGSIMYDFERDIATICDIDFFRKAPAVNDMGENYWGTKRLKAPEEYILGADIDSSTNVFTLGALLLHFFGTYTDDEIRRMYAENAFFPCEYGAWGDSEALYKIAVKAVSHERIDRYGSVKAFYADWKANLHK